MNIKTWLLIGLTLGLTAVCALAASPFAAEATALQRAGQPVIQVVLKIPAGHFIYAEHLNVTATDGVRLTPLDPPRPIVIRDKFTEADKQVFDRDVTLLYRPEPRRPNIALTVEFQGCNDSVCFFPETKTFALTWAGLPVLLCEVSEGSLRYEARAPRSETPSPAMTNAGQPAPPAPGSPSRPRPRAISTVKSSWRFSTPPPAERQRPRPPAPSSSG
ncbi:MAG: protein-disulfide reductase DsbD N-terminal domain-containing protein [Kiritimatiellaeota bacterium]|nr:protein-disulfide reductase DsbD N-terminal domain-containing protein [Kiritimatiellota bacterium]